jgi:hypothetical protein
MSMAVVFGIVFVNVDERPFNEKNKAIWNQCDFGILCHKCNFHISVVREKQWLSSALRYVIGW